MDGYSIVWHLLSVYAKHHASQVTVIGRYQLLRDVRGELTPNSRNSVREKNVFGTINGFGRVSLGTRWMCTLRFAFSFLPSLHLVLPVCFVAIRVVEHRQEVRSHLHDDERNDVEKDEVHPKPVALVLYVCH